MVKQYGSFKTVVINTAYVFFLFYHVKIAALCKVFYDIIRLDDQLKVLWFGQDTKHT